MAPDLEYALRPFAELTPHELYALLRLRAEVFVVEQDCVFQDLDGHDLSATHLLGRRGDDLLAYARWYPVPEGNHLGRIVTSPGARGRGFGRATVAESLRRIGDRPIVIQAQRHLESFYESYGFGRTGPDFLLDGILHVRMFRP